MNPPLPRSRRFLLTASAFALALATLALPARADEKKDSAKDSPKDGDKVVLFNGKDLSGWKTVDDKVKDHWKVAAEVKLDAKDPKKLAGSGAPTEGNGVLVLEEATHGADLFCDKTFGDAEVHVEFMVPKGSNSGVYLMGQYEIQVFDSFGKAKVEKGDCAAVYGISAPSENAAKAPGEWQTFDIVYRAPRFDASGKKTENAKVVSVTWNGKKVQENVEVKGGTGSQLAGGEKPQGPLMFQGNHGSVAFRNVWVKPTESK